MEINVLFWHLGNWVQLMHVLRGEEILGLRIKISCFSIRGEDGGANRVDYCKYIIDFFHVE
jgi:hypothetical protein